MYSFIDVFIDIVKISPYQILLVLFSMVLN